MPHALADSGDRAALAVRAWLALHRGDLAAAQRDATCAVGPNRPEEVSRWWLTMADAALGTAQIWDGQAAGAVGTLAATAQEAAGPATGTSRSGHWTRVPPGCC